MKNIIIIIITFIDFKYIYINIEIKNNFNNYKLETGNWIIYGESDVAQFFETPRSEALDELVGFIDDAAHALAVDAARVLHAEQVGYGGPVGQRRPALSVHLTHHVPALGRHGQETGSRGAGARTVNGDEIFVAVEGVDVVVDPLQRHGQIQHAIVARRVFVARAQES